MAGKNLMNRRNNVKKRPKLPMNVQISTQVGEYIAQLDGR